MENVDFAKYQALCQDLGELHHPDCPIVAYQNEDGVCHHHACEGDHRDECGKIHEVIR